MLAILHVHRRHVDLLLPAMTPAEVHHLHGRGFNLLPRDAAVTGSGRAAQRPVGRQGDNRGATGRRRCEALLPVRDRVQAEEVVVVLFRSHSIVDGMDVMGGSVLSSE